MRFEPSLHLVDVTERGALVAWGGFWLDDGGGQRRVVDDDELPPGGTIGACSPSYGHAVVEARSGDRLVARGETSDVNHVWLEGLDSDTTYTYRVTVDGQPWVPSDGTLRTHPAEDAVVPVTFVALGDYGVGIDDGEHGRQQAAVARTLERLVATRDVRCVVGLGDNIYGRGPDHEEQSGDEDDDWYFAFYEPYRRVIDRVPLYPAAGNHDSADEEKNDDRAQLEDNFHLRSRFEPREARGLASLGPGLFYRLRLGALLELVCVDTSWGAERGTHWFEDQEHRAWLEASLRDEPAPAWRIPFSHHPAWCAGPSHPGLRELVEVVVPVYREVGVRLLLHGHEHNLQHGRVDGLEYLISGAGGKLTAEPPGNFEAAGTVSWAAEPHCLLVEVDEDRVVVTPYAGMDELETEPHVVERRTPQDEAVTGPIVVERDR